MIEKLRLLNKCFQSKSWLRHASLSILGAGLGYAYYYFVGCRTGACPISSNPYISTIYGAGVGLLIPTKKKV
jgi:hypothetical protein